MIHLLSDPRLDKAGVKRLHPTWRRIRRHTRRTVSFAPLNSEGPSLYLVSAVLPFSKRGRLRIPGLKSERMYNREKFTSLLPAASQSGSRTFSPATAVFKLTHAKPQTPGIFLLKEKQKCGAPAGDRKLRTRPGRNLMCFAVSLGMAPAAEARCKKPLTPIGVPHEFCFFRVARQPQQPVVQALKKI